MPQAPTSDAQSTTTPDLEANARLFAATFGRAIASPATIRSCMDAIRHLDDYLATNGMPRDLEQHPLCHSHDLLSVAIRR